MPDEAQSDPRRPRRVHVAREGATADRLRGAEAEGGKHGEGQEAQQLCEGQGQQSGIATAGERSRTEAGRHTEMKRGAERRPY